MDVYSTDTDSGLLTVIRNQNGKFERVAQIRVGNAPGEVLNSLLMDVVLFRIQAPILSLKLMR